MKKKPNIRNFTTSNEFKNHADRMGADVTDKKESWKISTDEGSVHLPKNADLDRHYRSYLIKQFIRLGIFIFFIGMIVHFLW
jgi:hypothetical protein